MSEGKCPTCGSRSFYVKDPEDPYEVHEFELLEGAVRFKPGEAESPEPPELRGETETYCNRCAWHGRFNTLK